MKFAADKTVDAFDINVDTDDGNVTLTGKVRAKTDADQAVALARTVEGVKTVTPRLTITNE
jgi:hyperosmotically inducible protein